MTESTNGDRPESNPEPDALSEFDDPAEQAQPSADDASTSTAERGDLQSSDDAAITQPVTRPIDAATQPTGEQPVVEPMVIAPSSLRGPSHEQPVHEAVSTDAQPVEAPSGPDQPVAEALPEEPPALVEPKRPTLSLHHDAPVASPVAIDEAIAEAEREPATPVEDTEVIEPIAQEAAAPEFTQSQHVEPAPTQAMPTAAFETEFATPLPSDDELAATARIGTQQAAPTVVAPTITVDEEIARAAATGSPIVLVETPQPPRKKGARTVGFFVNLLATVVLGVLLAGAYFAVRYLFDGQTDFSEEIVSLWLRPIWLLPVAVFFLAYWLWTIIVNRAGWWAHVLGAFVIALLVYGAAIVGAQLDAEGGWLQYRALASVPGSEINALLLAPYSVLAFVLAREVPIWVGGIVSRRGRKAKQRNREALDAFEAENAEKLAAYERSRG